MTETIPREELELDATSSIPDDHSLAEVAELAERMAALEREIIAAEDALDVKRQELRRFAEQLVPDAMRSLGLSDLRLASGERVEVKPIVRASIPGEHRPAAHAWLRENGFGDLVKHEVTADFGRGRDEDVGAALRFLELELHATVSDREIVHPSTLAAFVREQDKAGRALPEQLLGVFRADVAKVTKPRAK